MLEGGNYLSSSLIRNPKPQVSKGVENAKGEEALGSPGGASDRRCILNMWGFPKLGVPFYGSL